LLGWPLLRWPLHGRLQLWGAVSGRLHDGRWIHRLLARPLPLPLLALPIVPAALFPHLFFAQQLPRIAVEDAIPDHDAGAALVDEADVDEALIVGAAVDDPAPGGRQRFDARAGA